MDGAGTDEETLIEIICARNNDEIQELVDTYERSKHFPNLFFVQTPN